MIGFTNGTFYRDESIDRWGKETMDVFLEAGCQTLELNCIDLDSLDDGLSMDPKIIADFEYISMHAPSKITYKDDNETRKILEKMENFCKRFGITTVVLHPDVVEDWEVIKEFPNIPFAVENMDQNKNFGTTLKELKSVLDGTNFSFVLDINHVLTLDPSLELANKLINSFEDRLVEVHLSGYRENLLHAPLFETKQDELIDLVKDLGAPIIIESVLETFEQVKKEVDYIKNSF